jgi:hypothetical protein
MIVRRIIYSSLTAPFPTDNRGDMTGAQLRQRIDKLGVYYTEAAKLLGLSLPGLHHQLRGERAVTRQTEMLLERIEADRAAQAPAAAATGTDPSIARGQRGRT